MTSRESGHMNASPAPAPDNESRGASFFVQSNARLWLVAISLLAIIVAMLLCHSQVGTLRRQIEKQQGDIQQTWLDSSLEIMGHWQSKLVEQCHFISQPEAFRLFVKDLTKLDAADLELVRTGEIGIRHPRYALAAEMEYHSSLLQRLLDKRGWLRGCVLSPGGATLLASRDDQPLTASQRQLVKQAQENRGMAYSAVRMENNVPVMDIVDPLFEVMSEASPTTVGFLLVTVPLGDVLHRMLAESEVVGNQYTPMLLSWDTDNVTGVQRTGGALASVTVANAGTVTSNGKTTLEPRKNLEAGLQGWAFGRRMGVAGDTEVFSTAKHLLIPNCPNWYVVLERPADQLDGEIFRRSLWIYGMGLLASLGVSLVLFIFVNQAYFKQRATRAQRCIEGLVHGIECSLDGQGNEGRYLQGRSQKIDKISAMIGKVMHRSEASLETLRLAARLSQVGKIFVPRDLMTKKGLFTNEERRQVQMAPFHAYNVLKGMLPDNVASTIYQMGGKVVVNEQTGEIRDLAPAEMTQEARILMVANDFCAMVSQRGTRAPLSYDEARQKLRENKNYDPAVVEALQTIADATLQQVVSDGEMSLEV